MSYRIAAIYRFVTIEDLPTVRRELLDICVGEAVCGTLLIASEGINGTIAAAPDAIARVVDLLDARLGIRQGEVKFSDSSEKPFRRMKVRIRPEIITMRAPQANPALKAGTYVAPRDWNAIIEDPDVVVVDTRNRYETRIGTFRGAIDPRIESFTQFKSFVAEELDPARHRKVAMFCTGGIRCEKASAYMLAEGFEEVFHLKGGILQYLEDVAAEDSLWDGDCYVFDGRVAVGQGLAEADYTQCFGCGAALTAEETRAPGFEAGVSCLHCRARLTPERAEGLRLRHAERTRLPR
ncbi:rhodanese-related sulfurtransferase [Aureimonas altamirensis]|uniref:oxygen-dependent tRNA uridine(34) hydroxylase TrhO n=1 Tax=Aureimonas altamirensis TaxID=370622 RepID=UPI002036FD58|nr:rhodanese-related sulfurtransferase [Aureimonas altamirensis]MCM2503095.1 rhodanese-related sulfurtransferase [Aureimonas altamirensis]